MKLIKALKRVIAMNESQLAIDLAKQNPNQDDLQALVDREGLQEEEISELMYDLYNLQVRNLKNPEPAQEGSSGATGHEEIIKDLLEMPEDDLLEYLRTELQESYEDSELQSFNLEELLDAEEVRNAYEGDAAWSPRLRKILTPFYEKLFEEITSGKLVGEG